MSAFNINTGTGTYASEVAMSGAPEVRLANGNPEIPQHYLRFNQTIHSISEILADVACHDSILLFAGEDSGLVYIQAGIIGVENYPGAEVVLSQKLVYGRRWFIRPDTPTSEVIQTAMLAIKKLREHEVRELFTIRDDGTDLQSAALSCHQDLPLMSKNPGLVMQASKIQLQPGMNIKQALDLVEFDRRTFKIVKVVNLSDQLVVKISLEPAQVRTLQHSTLHDFDTFQCTLILDSDDGENLLYELMDSLIAHSDRFVEESFTFKGFKRFSRDNSLLEIAALSIATRQYTRDLQDEKFSNVFKKTNFETDAGRTPALGSGNLAAKNRALLKEYKHLDGHMPQGFLKNYDDQPSYLQILP